MESFFGSSLLSYSPNEGQSWNEVAEDDKLYSEHAVWQVVQGDEEYDYKSSFENSKSWQFCSAEAVLYEAINGMAPSEEVEERNNEYLKAIEENLSYKVYTGWRTWFRQSSNLPSGGANVTMFRFEHYNYQPAVPPQPFSE